MITFMYILCQPKDDTIPYNDPRVSVYSNRGQIITRRCTRFRKRSGSIFIRMRMKYTSYYGTKNYDVRCN